MSEIISIDDVDSKKIIIETLQAHKIVIMPCDTIYGIVGIVPHSDQRIREVKGRSETKPFIQLVTLEMALKISKTYLPERVLAFWPGPLTLIVESKENLSLAIRVPKDPLLLSIIEELGAPIYSSSVNISGEATLLDFPRMIERFKKDIPLYVKGHNNQGTIASTILDVRTYPYTVIRQGALDVSILVV